MFKAFRLYWLVRNLLWVTPCVLMVMYYRFFNIAYPSLGHDYHYFFPLLLTGNWHFHHFGLLPFRYSPHLGGGMPIYGNPQDIYYSLVQAFAFVLDPWTATQAGVLLTIFLGYLGWFLFGKNVMQLSNCWAHVLALVMCANGFYLLHIMAGHLTFHTFPLVGLVLYLLLDSKCDNNRRTLFLRVALSAIITSYILYAGGYLVLFFLCFGLIIFSPIIFGVRPYYFSYAYFKRVFLCGLATVFLSSSKLVAIFSLMHYFPRNAIFSRMEVDYWGALVYVVKALWRIPQNTEAYGIGFGIHEMVLGFSPVTAVGLLFAIVLFCKRGIYKNMIRITHVLIVAYALFTVFVFVQFGRGYGVFVSLLNEKVFFFSSMRIPNRFLYIFAIFVSIISIYGLSNFFNIKRLKIFSGSACIIAVISSLFFFYYTHSALLRSGALGYWVNYDAIASHLSTLRAQKYYSQEIREMHIGFTDYLHTSGTGHGDPLLGALYPRWGLLKEGSIFQYFDGAYNMMNPACAQYPSENDCLPGDRIRSLQDLKDFAGGKRIGWKLSKWQIAADGISFTMLCSSLGYILYFFVNKWIHVKF